MYLSCKTSVLEKILTFIDCCETGSESDSEVKKNFL